MNLLASLIIPLVFRVSVIPAQFQDCSLAMSRSAIQQTLDDSSEYLDAQFRGTETFSFTLLPTITLSQNTAYYGANSGNTKDALIQDAVLEALDLAHMDGDSDCILIFCAGTSEADGAGEDRIWPQQGTLPDGRSFVTACETKTDSGKKPRPYGISIICHELLHCFGVPDLYDTDSYGSGGFFDIKWGSFSLMAHGTLNDDGRTPPNFSAVELELLGIGQCDTLKAGSYRLSPVGRSARYIKAISAVKDEFFLIECRAEEGYDRHIGGSGLLIYHVDRSMPDWYGKWKENAVNRNPSHPCVMLMEAEPGTGNTARMFYPLEGRDFFASDTEPPFMFWDGMTAQYALLDIKREADGDVSFDAVEPIHLDGLASFQDAAIINWHVNPRFSASSATVEWESSRDSGSTTLQEGSSITIEGLAPQTQYMLKISCTMTDGRTFSTRSLFTTKSLKDETYPYIYLKGADRRPDGSFFPNTRIPLRIYNAQQVERVDWYLGQEAISPEADGYYTLSRNGRLKAVIHYSDGNTETIIKEISIR